MFFFLLFFFFQAEDGIRGLTVTGVQTCALPISFKSGERTGYNPHATANGHERVWLGTQALAKPRTQNPHFLVWKRSGLAIEANQPNDTWDLQHANPVAEGNTHENVTGKERQFQVHAPIFPAADLAINWEEVFDFPR